VLPPLPRQRRLRHQRFRG